MTFYFVVALLGHYGGPDSAFGQVQAFFSGIGASLDPSVALDARSYDLATVSIGMEVLLVALMMTCMPLGFVHLIVSVRMALAFCGPRGPYLVSTNAAGERTRDV